MQAKSLGFRSFIHFTTLTVLGLCLCLLSSTAVRAQKTPSIFKTEGGDKGRSTSATNMDYINGLEAQYKSLESTDKEKAKIIRNKLIFIAVEQVDTEFNNYRKQSRKRTDLLQFIFDFLEVGASVAIAVTNGERAKEVIAEALTGFKGARTSFTKTFRLLEMQILFNKMVTNRSQRLSAIYNKLNDDVLSYPWERARTELRDYFFAGTIDDALSSLNIGTGAEASDSEEELEAIKERAGIVGAPTREQITASSTSAKTIDALSAINRDATKRAADADKRITLAEARIVEANKTNPPTADLAPAQTEKTNAQAAKKTATDDQSNVLAKMKKIYEEVEADPTLSPLLDKLAEGRGIQPTQSARIRDSLSKIKEGTATFTDYQRILLQLNRAVVDIMPTDPTPNEQYQKILEANK